MAKESHKALRNLTEAITELAEVVRDIKPHLRKYDRIASLLESARGHIKQAEEFERR